METVICKNAVGGVTMGIISKTSLGIREGYCKEKCRLRRSKEKAE